MVVWFRDPREDIRKPGRTAHLSGAALAPAVPDDLAAVTPAETKKEPAAPFSIQKQRFGSGDRLFVHGLHGQANTALLVDFQHLDLDGLAFAQLVAHVLDALVRDLRDAHQAVAAGETRRERGAAHELG